MSLKLGDLVPDFTAESTHGLINLYDYIQNSWVILFSHPNDFTPVCTTELAAVAKLMPEFQKKGVKVLALSCNDVASHKAWIRDIESLTLDGCSVTYPIVADPGRSIAVSYGMLDPDEKDSQGTPLTARAVFIIGPDKRLKLSILYPATTGRNFAEILRVLDSLQLTANYKVATPSDWKQGEDCMVLPNLSNSEAQQVFPKGFKMVPLPSGKDYLRLTPQPDS
eukprot:TRINITY_DN35563_c0_g1_i1.p1 TRINITY_DN35563_c0_g1~~TRINITY_DN35563_c0_g1_i1.p1  ORF type:complete len:223 (+),score=24.58 TRINITY_DN35563_c0_g1_i1:112-780(+)